MLKRTLFFESPGYVNLSDKQLCFSPRLPRGDQSTKRVPIEDIGLIVVENSQIIFTSAVMQALAANNAIVVFCDEKHLPASTFSAMNAHSTMQRTVQAQLKSTEALRGRLWKQTVSAKIINQSQVLSRNKRPNSGVLLRLAAQVKNGDPENIEATAARYYFSSISKDSDFIRDPEGIVSALQVTDRQFGDTVNFIGKQTKPPEPPPL